MNTVENLQPGKMYACSQECPVFVSGPEQAGMNPTRDWVFNTAVSPFETIISDRGDKNSGIDLSGLTGFLATKIAQFKKEITTVPSILRRNAEPVIKGISKELDVPPFLRREHVYHPEQRLKELKRGNFPWRRALALGLLTAFALWALSKDSPFVRRSDTESTGQVTITQLYPSPDAVLGGYVPAGSNGSPEPQETPSPFTNFINAKVIVQPGDTVWDLVKKAQIGSFGKGWVNSENGVERADAAAGIVVELMIKDGFNPHLLIPGQEFSIGDYIKDGVGMDVMEAAVKTESVEVYQKSVAPLVRQYFLP